MKRIVVAAFASAVVLMPLSAPAQAADLGKPTHSKVSAGTKAIDWESAPVRTQAIDWE